MTFRSLGLLLGGAGLIALGWDVGWPELTALGAASIALVVLSTIVAGPAPRVQVALDQTSMKVIRGQPATVRMKLELPRRRWRWLRVVEGSVAAPVATSPLKSPGPAGELSVKLPVDTSVRGERPIGPYSVVHGDPWSLVRRVAARAEGGVLMVHPRTVDFRRSQIPILHEGDSVAAGRRRGDEHFFALRDYVFGDEPRMVHWRSSARAGKLVVMQQVAPTPNHTLIVLDADASAYGHDDLFAGSGVVDERFESAVEVAASLAVAQADRAEEVHVVTTARGATVTSASGGKSEALLDAFAAVRSVPPVGTAPHEVVPLVRRTRCRLVLFVTGTPSVRALEAMRGVAAMTSFAVVRVGSRRDDDIPGLRVIDVDRAEDLVAA